LTTSPSFSTALHGTCNYKKPAANTVPKNKQDLLVASSEFHILPERYTRTVLDIICHRGVGTCVSMENISFALSTGSYSTGENMSKEIMTNSSQVVSDTISSVQTNTGYFLRMMDGDWHVVPVSLAREKYSHPSTSRYHDKISSKATHTNRWLKGPHFDWAVNCTLNHFNTVLRDRLKELTRDVKTESELQKAFNQTNIELLQYLKTIYRFEQQHINPLLSTRQALPEEPE